MPVSRRYSPEISPGESQIFGFDFSPVLAPGVGITSGQLDIVTNSAFPAQQTDLIPGPVQIVGRTAYAQVTANFSANGRDYMLIWLVFDTDGNTWERVAFLLCAYTS